MIYFLSWTTKKHFKKSTFQATTFYVNEIFSTYQGLVQKFKEFSMTPSKIQGLFKLQRYISTLFGQRGGQRENARVSQEAASKTSHSRVSFRQPLTRGLPKCRRLNMKGE